MWVVFVLLVTIALSLSTLGVSQSKMQNYEKWIKKEDMVKVQGGGDFCGKNMGIRNEKLMEIEEKVIWIMFPNKSPRYLRRI